MYLGVKSDRISARFFTEIQDDVDYQENPGDAEKVLSSQRVISLKAAEKANTRDEKSGDCPLGLSQF